MFSSFSSYTCDSWHVNTTQWPRQRRDESNYLLILICCDNLMGTHTTRHLPIFENQFELIYNCDERLICTSFLSRSRIEPTQPKQAEQLIYRIARLSCFCVFVLFFVVVDYCFGWWKCDDDGIFVYISGEGPTSNIEHTLY